MITTTVGDLLEILNRYAPDTPVVTSDPNGTGYYRITLTPMMVYRLMVNGDGDLPVDFVDSLAFDIPGAFSAIVL